MALELRRSYRDAFGHGMRPYLTVRLSGIQGRDVTAVGLVDSGADVTCLPMVMAALLGFRRSDLEPVAIQQLGGGQHAWRAMTPIRAQLVGAPATAIELTPIFAEGSRRSLWGRDDFFRAFEEICFHEQDWTMTLAAA